MRLELSRVVVALSLAAVGCGGHNAAVPDASTGVDRVIAEDAPSASDASDAAADGPDLPPVICKSAAPAVAGQPWFTEITQEVGLGTADAPLALGVSIRAVDLDGDGYPDIISTIGDAVREDPTAVPPVRHRFVLMNRPDPSDPSGRSRIFVDTTLESGLLATRDGVGGRGFSIANVGDVNNDGFPDVVVCPPTSDPTMAKDACDTFLNDGTAHFTMAPSSALDQAGPQDSASAALLDFDRDGLLDFWPAGFGTKPKLFKGQGDGTFVDVAAQMGLPTVDGDPATFQSFKRTYGVTACDLDGDGDLDVLLADYGREANQVWRNDGDHFTEVAMALGVAFDDRMDYSDDQSYLCYCQANPTMCPMGLPTPVFVCPGRGWVPGQSDQPWRLGGNNFSIACGDIDNDGDMDLMTATITHGDVGSSSDPSELLINNSPPGGPLMKFDRPGNMATGLYRPEPTLDYNHGDMMPVLADVDNDGRKDIYLSSSDYPGTHGWLWHQKTDGTFEDITGPAGVMQTSVHGIAIVDIDGDGDLDIIAGTSDFRAAAPNKALRVYRNDVGQDQNFVQLKLVGLGAGRSNVSAIGARVKVTAGGVTQLQEVSGGYGHNAIQNDLMLTFGLGAACDIDTVEVRWPDSASTVQTFTGVRANYLVQITEGSDQVTYRMR